MFESLGSISGVIAAAAFTHDGRVCSHQIFERGSGRGRQGALDPAGFWFACSCLDRAAEHYRAANRPTGLFYVEFSAGYLARSRGGVGSIIATVQRDVPIALVQVGLKVALFRLEQSLDTDEGVGSESLELYEGPEAPPPWQRNFAS